MNASNDERFTLAQSAQVLELSIPTVRRLVTSGRLQAIKTMHGDKPRWEVSKNEVLRLRDTRGNWPEFTSQPSLNPSNAFSEPRESIITERSGAKERFKKPSKPVNSTTLSKASNPSLDQVPLTAHLAALNLVEAMNNQALEWQQRAENATRRAELAERQRISLEFQLHQYQVALSDQAESLAEERAKRIAEEAANKKISEPPAESLKVDTPKAHGWRSRLKRLLFMQVG